MHKDEEDQHGWAIRVLAAIVKAFVVFMLLPVRLGQVLVRMTRKQRSN